MEYIELHFIKPGCIESIITRHILQNFQIDPNVTLKRRGYLKISKLELIVLMNKVT